MEPLGRFALCPMLDAVAGTSLSESSSAAVWVRFGRRRWVLCGARVDVVLEKLVRFSY